MIHGGGEEEEQDQECQPMGTMIFSWMTLEEEKEDVVNVRTVQKKIVGIAKIAKTWRSLEEKERPSRHVLK